MEPDPYLADCGGGAERLVQGEGELSFACTVVPGSWNKKFHTRMHMIRILYCCLFSGRLVLSGVPIRLQTYCSSLLSPLVLPLFLRTPKHYNALQCTVSRYENKQLHTPINMAYQHVHYALFPRMPLRHRQSGPKAVWLSFVFERHRSHDVSRAGTSELTGWGFKKWNSAKSAPITGCVWRTSYTAK
jgi:hypothetical protein